MLPSPWCSLAGSYCRTKGHILTRYREAGLPRAVCRHTDEGLMATGLAELPASRAFNRSERHAPYQSALGKFGEYLLHTVFRKASVGEWHSMPAKQKNRAPQRQRGSIARNESRTQKLNVLPDTAPGLYRSTSTSAPPGLVTCPGGVARKHALSEGLIPMATIAAFIDVTATRGLASHSCRSAMIGSILVARSAGIRLASTATTDRNSAAPKMLTGSSGLTR